jgi:hypothetical protein
MHAANAGECPRRGPATHAEEFRPGRGHAANAGKYPTIRAGDPSQGESPSRRRHAPNAEERHPSRAEERHPSRAEERHPSRRQAMSVGGEARTLEGKADLEREARRRANNQDGRDGAGPHDGRAGERPDSTREP